MKNPMGFEIINNAIDNSEEIISWMQEQPGWSRSTINSQVESDVRTSDTLPIPLLSFNNPSFIHNMNQIVWKAMDQYAKQWDFNFTEVENVSVQRYYASQNQHYGYHSDAGPGLHRILSALLYLNDVDGGETYFPHFDFAISPEAGKLVLFPSNFIYGHEARPPRSGVKFAAAYWARC